MSEEERRQLTEFQKTTKYPARRKILGSTRTLARKFRIPMKVLLEEFHRTRGASTRAKLSAIAKKYNIAHHGFTTRKANVSPVKLKKLRFLDKPQKTPRKRASKVKSPAVKSATERALKFLSRTRGISDEHPEPVEDPIVPNDPLADATFGDAEVPPEAIVDDGPATPPDPLADPAPIDDVEPQEAVTDGPIPDPLDDCTKADDNQPTQPTGVKRGRGRPRKV